MVVTLGLLLAGHLARPVGGELPRPELLDVLRRVTEVPLCDQPLAARVDDDGLHLGMDIELLDQVVNADGALGQVEPEAAFLLLRELIPALQHGVRALVLLGRAVDDAGVARLDVVPPPAISAHDDDVSGRLELLVDLVDDEDLALPLLDGQHGVGPGVARVDGQLHRQARIELHARVDRHLARRLFDANARHPNGQRRDSDVEILTGEDGTQPLDLRVILTAREHGEVGPRRHRVGV